MKKNLFLLFSIYFFTIQAVIIGFLRNETRFFTLGIINLFLILTISFFNIYFEKNRKKLDNEDHVSFKKERESVLSEKKQKKLFSEGKLIRITSIFMILAFFILDGYIITDKLIITIGSGLLVHLMIFYISELSKHKQFTKLLSSKIYFSIFLLLIIISIINNTTGNTDKKTIIGDIENTIVVLKDNLGYNNIEKNNEDKYDDNYIDVFDGEGTVLSQEYGETGDLDTSLSGDTELSTIETGGQKIDAITENSTGETIENNETQINTITENKNITILDAIKYLIDTNEIPLDTNKNIRFTHMSYQSPDYGYFKTAYIKKMIGTNTMPNNNIICQTYIVMKGLVEGRTISKNLNVVDAYRNAGTQLGKLNGCTKNKYVKTENL